MDKIYNNVRNAAYEVIAAKGSTSHGIGMGLSRISNAILAQSRRRIARFHLT